MTFISVVNILFWFIFTASSAPDATRIKVSHLIMQCYLFTKTYVKQNMVNKEVVNFIIYSIHILLDIYCRTRRCSSQCVCI